LFVQSIQKQQLTGSIEQDGKATRDAHALISITAHKNYKLIQNKNSRLNVANTSKLNIIHPVYLLNKPESDEVCISRQTVPNIDYTFSEE